MEIRFPYELVSRWRVPGRIDEVYAVLTDGEEMPRWWPNAYTRYREVSRGDPEGRGLTADVVTRGVLPYDINWRLQITEVEAPRLIRLVASGDLIGRGEWQLAQAGPDVAITYDWRVSVEKPWMQRLEFLLKPLFKLNHDYVMAKGETGLRQELARRNGGDKSL